MITLQEAIKSRHSIRSYLSKPITEDIRKELNAEIDACNQEGNLHIQLVTEERKAFSSMLAHYGKFSGVENYLVMAGKTDADLAGRIGYYGERIVLNAQMMGLNTCWVALTYSKGSMKKNIQLQKNEKVVCVISLGYGTVQGTDHHTKPVNELYHSEGDVPQWFMNGMNAVMLAPTAMNQQKFLFTYSNDIVTAKSLGGPYSDIDLGIVKFHFDCGSEKHIFQSAV